MKTVKLCRCCSFYCGGTPTKATAEYWVGNIPWFSPKDIKSFELVTSKDKINDSAVAASATRFVYSGTILVVGRSGVLAHTLPVGIVRQASAFNQDIKALVPNDGYDPEYIALFLKANQSEILKDGVKLGPTVHSLKSGFIENLEIPEIGIIAQRQFATHLKAQLADVEKARLAAMSQLMEIRTLQSKALESIFSGIEACAKIGTAAKVQSGYAFKSEFFQPSGVRLLRNANILPGKVYWDDSVYLKSSEGHRYPRYALFEGDVLISLDRPIISSGIKVARVSQEDLPALLVQRVGRFLIDQEKLDPDYLYAYLQTEMFVAEVSGHDQSLGVPHISPSQVESIVIPLPNIDTQKILARRLNEITSEIEKAKPALKCQLMDINALPAKILGQAFSTFSEGETP